MEKIKLSFQVIKRFNLFFGMKNQKINEKLIKKLQKIIEDQQLTTFIKKYKSQFKYEEINEKIKVPIKQENSIAKKHKRLTSQSKQRLLLCRKQSQKVLQKETNQQVQTNFQQQGATSQAKLPGKPIKDKAIFVNLQQVPYLHSTDLLNHLYKKPVSLTQQESESLTLYNPPANNPYALTKVKYLSIYYCKIESLRDMGTGWSNLVQLSVYFGRLKDLSGLNAFPSLQYLHCPFNFISTISDLMFHPTLVSVDFQSNLIADMSQVQHLFTVDNLEYINLSNNPVYQSKENKRKIQQKFDKIIDSQNNRFQQYVYEQKREIWELQNIQGIQYSNNILKEFFIQTKNDEITVQSKHQLISQNVQQTDFDLQTFQANFEKDTKKQQSPENNLKELRIEYIPSQIPQGQYFQQMIMKGSIDTYEEVTFCEQKIYLTPLISMIDKNSTYIGPVLDKYLKNKLYQKDQNVKPSQTINSVEQKQKKCENQVPKPKKISKLSMTTFSNKGFSSINSSQITVNEESVQEIQKSKEFATTASSFSTNCTNMNNTSTTFSMRRSRISLNKSKEKSINKIVMSKNVGENFTLNQIPSFDVNSLHSSSLAKQSRVILGRSLKKQSKEANQQTTQKSNLKNLERSHNEQHSTQKGSSFSSTLKRKSLLSHTKKQKSSILTRKQVDP